jgi:hypothetical protein
MLFYKNKKIADKGFVINLPHRTDRREMADRTLSEMGFDGYEFIDGFVFDDPEWKKFGCTQTYLNCSKYIIENNLNDVFIFEDDIKIMSGVNSIDIDNIFNNWEIAQNTYDLISLGSRPVPGSHIIKDSDFFGTVSNTLCTQSWYYKKNFLEYMFETLKDFKESSHTHYKVLIDEFINDCCSHEHIWKRPNKLFKVGISIPMIFTQYPSFSDVENSTQNYEGWIEYCYWESLKNGENIENENTK